mgnify:CR=1 FL=1
MDNFNIDKNTMDKLNSMLKDGNLNDMLSQIPPDTLKNFSNMMSGNSSTAESSNSSEHSSNTNNFDFSNIDIDTMMKMKSVIEKMNNNSDPRKNLLQSLKPYLRDEKKSKLDQYSQLLNMTSLIELFNQTNGKENSRDQ